MEKREVKKLTGRILVIPDIHQDIRFVKAILAKEQDWDYVVFLGDYLDTFFESDGVRAYTAKNTCKYLVDLKEKLGDKAVFLVGNHDIHYLASYRYKESPRRSRYLCSGYTGSRAAAFNWNMTPSFVQGIELCCVANGWVLSHAGFSHLELGYNKRTEMEVIEARYSAWEREKGTFMHLPCHWIWFVSRSRGGSDPYGSCVWQDWEYDFESLQEVRQIVGHTSNSSAGIRKKHPEGRKEALDYCIDGAQTCYAIIEKDGSFNGRNLSWAERMRLGD